MSAAILENITSPWGMVVCTIIAVMVIAGFWNSLKGVGLFLKKVFSRMKKVKAGQYEIELNADEKESSSAGSSSTQAQPSRAKDILPGSVIVASRMAIEHVITQPIDYVLDLSGKQRGLSKELYEEQMRHSRKLISCIQNSIVLSYWEKVSNTPDTSQKHFELLLKNDFEAIVYSKLSDFFVKNHLSSRNEEEFDMNVDLTANDIIRQLEYSINFYDKAISQKAAMAALRDATSDLYEAAREAMKMAKRKTIDYEARVRAQQDTVIENINRVVRENVPEMQDFDISQKGVLDSLTKRT